MLDHFDSRRKHLCTEVANRTIPIVIHLFCFIPGSEKKKKTFCGFNVQSECDLYIRALHVPMAVSIF